MKITPLFLKGIALVCFGAASIPAWSAPAVKSKTVAPKIAAPSALPKGWKVATGAQRAAAAASIRAQLEAFKRDDWANAATYQSAGLRQNFGTIAQFRAVIETNYPQFAKYQSVAFGQSIALGDAVQIQARLVGTDGVKIGAVYLMRKEKGIYHVEGVQGGGVVGKQNPLPQSPADYV